MSSALPNGYLAEFIELFLKELRAFGLFSSQLSHRKAPPKARFEAYVSERLPFFSQTIRAIETVSNLSVREESIPILYNTLDWTPNVPIAMYSNPDCPIKYSSLITTYIGNWKYEHDNGLFYGRLLRVALYMWKKAGLKGAIDYLFDLERYGYFTLPQAIEQIIYLLIEFHAKGSSADDIIFLCFNQRIPQTEDDWLKWDWNIGKALSIQSLLKRFATQSIDTETKNILEYIIISTVNIIQQTRQLIDPTDWMLEQAYIFIRCRQVIALCESFQLKKSVMLKSILDQFEEIQADSGSIILDSSDRQKFLPIRNPLVIHASAFLGIFQANLGIEEGENRLFNERVIYPAALRQQMLHQRDERDLGDWAIVPPRIQYPFVASRYDGRFAPTLDQDLKKMQESLIETIKITRVPVKEMLLKKLHKAYPYLAPLHLESAIFYDKQGDLPKAWEYILTALILEPEEALHWQSLSVILKRLGNTTESQLALAISQFLLQGDD